MDIVMAAGTERMVHDAGVWRMAHGVAGRWRMVQHSDGRGHRADGPRCGCMADSARRVNGGKAGEWRKVQHSDGRAHKADGAV